MADILPKVRSFIFISLVSLLINLSVCAVVFAMDSTTSLNTGETTEQIGGSTGGFSLNPLDWVSSLIGKTITASFTSFLPFFDLINVATLNLIEIPLFLIFYGIITTLLGAVKLFLIITIIANYVPTVNV